MATKIKKKFIEDVIFSDITTEISNAVEVEKVRAEAVEAVLSADVASNDVDIAANADAISAEQDRAEAAEAGLATAISAEETRAMAAESANATAISDEETRAMAAESANATAISDEETRAMAAESANADAISAEQARAEGVEAALQASIDFITDNADPAAIDSLTEVVAAFQGADSNLNQAITDLSSAASADRALIRTEFADADSLLEAQIVSNDSDIADLQAEDVNLQSQIDTINSTGIGSVQNELDDTQAGAGLEADGSYSANASMSYVQAASSLKDADEKLDAGLAAEAARAMAAEGVNATAISDEETRAMAAESALQSELDATQSGAGLEADGSFSTDRLVWESNMGVNNSEGEMKPLSLKEAAENLDATLAFLVQNKIIPNEQAIAVNATAISDEETRAMAAESANADAISAEQARAEGVEAGLATAISDEETRAMAAESANADAISAEETRAMGVEAALQASIDFITDNADPAALDSLTEIVAAFQGADSNLNQAITDLSSAASADRALIRTEFADADTGLQENIDAEAARAMAAEGVNATAISDEETRAMAAESANATAISAEQDRAEAAEADLLSQIQSNDTDIAALQSDLDNLSGAGGFATDAELQAEVNSLTSADSALSDRIQVFEQVEWYLEKFVIEQSDLDNGYVSISLDKGAAYSGAPAFVFVDRLAAFEDEDFYFDVQPDGVTVHVVFTGLVDGMSSEQLAIGDEVRVKFVRRC